MNSINDMVCWWQRKYYLHIFVKRYVEKIFTRYLALIGWKLVFKKAIATAVEAVSRLKLHPCAAFVLEPFFKTFYFCSLLFSIWNISL